MLVSVLINNYNYGRYLGEAIDSALGQTYPHVEVVVVDDGSTDDSRSVIDRYGKRIISVLKFNGGQASAVNAGFAASSGEVICWLDADDVFVSDKVQRILEFLDSRDLRARDVLIAHPVRIVDAAGRPSGDRFDPLPHRYGENYYEYAKRYRTVPYVASMPSGVAVTRSLAAKVCPLPEDFPSGADNFFVRACALLGEAHTLDRTLALYRAHGCNHWYTHRKPKDRAFRLVEDAYLNQRLVAYEFEPVVSYFSSWDAREYYMYHRCPRELAMLAVRVPLHHLDTRTCRFLLTSLLKAGALVVRGRLARKSRRPAACS